MRWNIPASHWFHIPWQIIVACFCVYWYWRPPAPSKAVLILAGVTVVMALLDMRPSHKAIYLLLVICLMFIENRAINKDRSESETRQGNFIQEQRQRFDSIGNGIKQAIMQSDKQFSATMGSLNALITESNGISREAKESIYSVTGWGYLLFFGIKSCPKWLGDGCLRRLSVD